MNFARAYYLQLNKVSHMALARTMCHAGLKSARPFIAPSLSPSKDWLRQSRFVPTVLSGIEQKNQEWWEEAVDSIDFSHSSRKAWSTFNIFTGRSGRSSRLCSVSANFIASQLVKSGGHTRLGAVSPLSPSTSSCPTYGRSQHLRETVSLALSGQRSFLWPSGAWGQKVCICWRPSNHACWWRLVGSGRGADQGHGNRRWIPPDLEAKD